MRSALPTPARICILVERDALCAWIPALAAALQSRYGARLSVVLTDCDNGSGETAFKTLLTLESMLLRRGKRSWSDRLEPDALAIDSSDTIADADLVIDLTATERAPASTTVLRPLFDGAPGEIGLATALLFGRTPKLVIERLAPGQSRPVEVARGVASLEAAAGIGGAMESVWSRVKLLLMAAIDGNGPEGRLFSMSPGPGRIRHTDMMRYAAKTVARAAAHAAYRLCFHAPHWRVGWRFADPSNDIWSRRDLSGIPWQILVDPIDHFYADPFPFVWKGRDYIFFEALEHRTQKGIIAFVAFDEDGRPGPSVPVLEEPWHLSYPFLIEAEGEVWMIPESSLSGEITLYRAVDFPLRWERHSTLVANIEAADATIVAHQGKLWMFAVTRENIGGYSDTLAIWTADRLTGPWRPHPGNPVLIDDRYARPAGNMVLRDGHLMRPVQDCRNGYGTALALARITRLDEEGFEQVIETRLAPGPGWPGRKLHTLNSNGRLEAIDGAVLRPKSGMAARFVDKLYRPSSG